MQTDNSALKPAEVAAAWAAAWAEAWAEAWGEAADDPLPKV